MAEALFWFFCCALITDLHINQPALFWYFTGWEQMSSRLCTIAVLTPKFIICILILVSDFAIYRHTLTLAVCWRLYAHRVITRPGWMSNNAPLNGGERVGHWALLSETPVSFRGQLKRAQKSDSVLREDKVHSRHLSNLQALRIKGRLLLLY